MVVGQARVAGPCVAGSGIIIDHSPPCLRTRTKELGNGLRRLN